MTDPSIQSIQTSPGECPPHELIDGGRHCGKCGATLVGQDPAGWKLGDALLPGVDSGELWELPPGELVTAIPMLQAARAQLGKPVEIHVIGGLTASGRLDVVDEDDGTVTVVDDARRFVIALNAIAVLATRLKVTNG